MFSGNSTFSVQGSEENFAEMLMEHIGKKVYVFTNFLGTNTPQIPIIGQLEYVSSDAVIVYSESKFWILLHRNDIAYVILTRKSTRLKRSNPDVNINQNVSTVYVSDIVAMNLGKKVDVFLNFMGNGPNGRIFEGVLRVAGQNFLTINVLTMGGELMLSWTNLAYVIFREKPTFPKEGETLPHEYITTTYADVALENIGKKITAWTFFVGHSPPERRILVGKILVVGENAFIIDAKQIGGPTMVFYSNVAYVVFNEGLLVPKKMEKLLEYKPPPEQAR